MSNKPRVLLAVGERALETILKNELSQDYTFVKEASYREIVIQRIREEHPDVVLLREALKGSMPIDNLVLDIRQTFPEIRVIFYTKKYRPGEPLLRRLVSYGVYDFIGGESVTKQQIFDGLNQRKQLSDVRKYLDAPELPSDTPTMHVTTEYKDLSTTQPEPKAIPKQKEVVVQKNTEDDEPTKPVKEKVKKEKGFFKRMLPFGKKGNSESDTGESMSDTQNSKQENFSIDIDDDPEEERSFWGEDPSVQQKTETPPVSKPAFQSPLPMFHQDAPKETAPEPVDTQEVPVPEPVEHAEPKVSEEPQKTEPAPKEETYHKPNVEYLDDAEPEEEDLFAKSVSQAVVQPKPVPEPEPEPEVESPILVDTPVAEAPSESHDTLKFKPRGKPNVQGDELALHRKETMDEPEIDFNPMDVDSANRAAITEQPAPVQHRDPAPVDAPIEHNEETSEGWTGRKTKGTIKVANKQIVTFVGATHGVGNTHVAFNAAIKLAEEGNRVLYMEAHSVFSSVDFSMQLGTWQQGIEKALEDIEYNQGMNVGDHILRIKDLKKNAKKDKALRKLYKPLPDTLDYMFYSQDYQTLEEQHAVPKERLKDLVMYLLTREAYDVIVVDSEPVGNPGVDGLLNISSKVYITMTQDPAQMGVFHRQFDATQKRIKITNNRYIIVNQFVKTEPTVKRIQKWTNEKVLQTVPFTHRDVVTANFLGVAFIQKTKHQPAINAFDSLIEHIAE